MPFSRKKLNYYNKNRGSKRFVWYSIVAANRDESGITPKLTQREALFLKEINTLPKVFILKNFPQKRFDLVVEAVQNFEFSTDFVNLTNRISFKNSEKNTFYYSYTNFIRSRQTALKTRLTPE